MAGFEVTTEVCSLEDEKSYRGARVRGVIFQRFTEAFVGADSIKTEDTPFAACCTAHKLLLDSESNHS